MSKRERHASSTLLSSAATVPSEASASLSDKNPPRSFSADAVGGEE